MNIYLGFLYVLITVMEIAHEAELSRSVNDIKIITTRISLEKRFNFLCEKKPKKSHAKVQSLDF